MHRSNPKAPTSVCITSVFLWTARDWSSPRIRITFLMTRANTRTTPRAMFGPRRARAALAWHMRRYSLCGRRHVHLCSLTSTSSDPSDVESESTSAADATAACLAAGVVACPSVGAGQRNGRGQGHCQCHRPSHGGFSSLAVSVSRPLRLAT